MKQKPKGQWKKKLPAIARRVTSLFQASWATAIRTMLKDNDTDFPEPDAKPEHSGQ
jgi:hypothetical protein